jgi:hypothetical protein
LERSQVPQQHLILVKHGGGELHRFITHASKAFSEGASSSLAFPFNESKGFFCGAARTATTLSDMHNLCPRTGGKEQTQQQAHPPRNTRYQLQRMNERHQGAHVHTHTDLRGCASIMPAFLHEGAGNYMREREVDQL